MSLHLRLFTLAAALICGGTGAALAAPECFLRDNLGGTLATVQGTGRAPMERATGPQGDACTRVAGCGTAGYVLPGDSLIVGAASGGYHCVTFVSVKGTATTAWLATKRLKSVTPPTPALTAWAGRWQLEAQEIAVRLVQGALEVRGYAQWPWQAAPGQKDFAPNLGSLSQRGLPQGGVLAAAGQCSVKVRLLGPYLLVNDSTGEACWGANVSFSGIYRQAAHSLSDKEWTGLGGH